MAASPSRYLRRPESMFRTTASGRYYWGISLPLVTVAVRNEAFSHPFRCAKKDVSGGRSLSDANALRDVLPEPNKCGILSASVLPVLSGDREE